MGGKKDKGEKKLKRVETSEDLKRHIQAKRRILGELGIELSYSDVERLATARNSIQVDNIARAIIQKAS